MRQLFISRLSLMFYYGLYLLQADVVVGLSQPHPKNVMDRRDALMVSTTSMVAAVVGPATATVSNAAYIDPENVKITQKVYMNVEFASNNQKGGKIVIGVYGDAMPRVTENFVTLCRNNQYAGTTFYRIISDVTVQGGAIGDPSGKTGQSSLDDKKSFEPDHYVGPMIDMLPLVLSWREWIWSIKWNKKRSNHPKMLPYPPLPLFRVAFCSP